MIFVATPGSLNLHPRGIRRREPLCARSDICLRARLAFVEMAIGHPGMRIKLIKRFCFSAFEAALHA